MNNNKKPPQLLININSNNEKEKVDPADLEHNAQDLREELIELDIIEKVDLVTRGRTPNGSKSSGEMVVLGSILASLATSAGSSLIPSITTTIQSWLTRNNNRKISLEIEGDKLEVTGLSNKDQQMLVNFWISKHISK